MLKDITTIKIQGASFSSPTSFVFFNPINGKKVRTVKAALLYGRNGTGKSTIAKAFRKIKGENISGINSASVCDSTGNEVSLTGEEKDHIFVFDEEFVYKNVRLQEDHLDTIVMLGEAADLTDEIEEMEAKRDKAKNEYSIQDATYKEFLDYKNPQSPKYYLLKMGNALRGDDCWAGRDKLIKGARQNTTVRDDTYKQFVKLMPMKSKSELLVDFNTQMRALENAQSGASTIDISVPSFPESYLEYDDSRLMNLLAESIEKPKLTAREKYLLKIVEDGKSFELSQRLDLLKQEETDTCPFCLQSISVEYKADLISSIERVLSKRVENHQENLNQRLYEEIVIDLSPYEKLTGCLECVRLLKKVNTIILSNNEHIHKKIANPYESIIIEKTRVADMATKLKDALWELEEERRAYNSSVTKTDPIKEELNRINSEIAHYDVIDWAKQYEKQVEACALEEEKNDLLKQAWEDLEKNVENLQARRRSVHLALDAINSCLKYIFFSDNRLRIEYVDGVYKLLSNGQSVRPCDVSVGERNIIGLSYFFTRMMEGQDVKDVYDQEYILVIDDPVSSYDVENRIGILSFLKYKIGEFLEGNKNTKALVMTHDLMTFYDIHKVLEEIVKECKGKGYDNLPIFHCFELRNKVINTFEYKHRQEYTELVERIYKYARGEAEEHELIIGNMMRQVLEAFSTFQYKSSIEHVSTDSQILSVLKEPEYITYFKNLMYRLVLHGGSHREEQVQAMYDLSFFSLITDDEKKRTARDILCFIYLLNKQHLLVHLGNCNDVESTLKNWCQDIKRNSVIV